jgi:hypothetical protein
LTVQAGSASTPSLTTAGDTNTGIFFPAADTIAFAEGGVESARIDSSGNMGVGTTSPATRLHVLDSLSGGQFIVANSQTNSSGKYGSFATQHYTNAEEPALCIAVESASNANNVLIGGALGEFNAATSIQFYTAANNTTTGGSERMRLDASGNLGIGTTSPSYRLDVAYNANATNFIRVGNTTAGGSSKAALFSVSDTSTGQFGTVSSTWSADAVINANETYVYGAGGLLLYSGSTSPLRFVTNGSERARITSAGDFLWQKTSVSSATNGINFENDGTNTARISIGGANSSSATGLSLYSTTAGAFRFFVSYAGQINATSTSITAISDQSLKENIRDLDTGLSEVMALRPRRFDWKEETQLPDRNVAGFIAQEVSQVLPELVYDYMYGEGVTKKSLKMGDMLPTLVKAIQEQQAIIESLKARLDAANL